MAQLDVQPKKSNPWWLWLLAGLILLVLIFYFLRDRNDTASTVDDKDTTALSSVTEGDDNWGMIDMDAPETNYEEVDNTDVSVRGNDNYAIYAVNETILFDSDKSEIRSAAEASLRQIAASVESVSVAEKFGFMVIQML